MLCFLKVLVGMPADVATTTDVAADQTNPQVLRRREEKASTQKKAEENKETIRQTMGNIYLLHAALKALVLLHRFWCLTVPTHRTPGNRAHIHLL